MILFEYAGTGTGFVLLSAFLVSGDYFKKRKALALGIISAGSGVGVLIIPNLLRALFDYMGFTGALLLYGECRDSETTSVLSHNYFEFLTVPSQCVLNLSFISFPLIGG